MEGYGTCTECGADVPLDYPGVHVCDRPVATQPIDHLARLREAEAARTPGVWGYPPEHPWPGLLYTTHAGGLKFDLARFIEIDNVTDAEANAAYVAACTEHVAPLLDEVERLRERLESVTVAAVARGAEDEPDTWAWQDPYSKVWYLHRDEEMYHRTLQRWLPREQVEDTEDGSFATLAEAWDAAEKLGGAE